MFAVGFGEFTAWSYSVRDGIVALDVIGDLSEFSLEAGPPAA